jgi:hypothetical protein
MLERMAGKKGGRSFIRRYQYRPVDAAGKIGIQMTDRKTSESPQARQLRYAQLRKQLENVEWISEGYVQDRGPGAGGPCYQWTRKVKGKTVSVALSKEQYLWLKKAIENWKALQATLKQMQQLSRTELFETVSGPPRRKALSKKVLGTK